MLGIKHYLKALARHTLFPKCPTKVFKEQRNTPAVGRHRAKRLDCCDALAGVLCHHRLNV